jgi:hypothetical protein
MIVVNRRHAFGIGGNAVTERRTITPETDCADGREPALRLPKGRPALAEGSPVTTWTIYLLHYFKPFWVNLYAVPTFSEVR